METQLLAKRKEKQPCVVNKGMIRELHCLVQQPALNCVMSFIAKHVVSSLNLSKRMEEYWGPATNSTSIYGWQTRRGFHDPCLLIVPLHNSLCLSACVSSNLLRSLEYGKGDRTYVRAHGNITCDCNLVFLEGSPNWLWRSQACHELPCEGSHMKRNWEELLTVQETEVCLTASVVMLLTVTWPWKKLQVRLQPRPTPWLKLSNETLKWRTQQSKASTAGPENNGVCAQSCPTLCDPTWLLCPWNFPGKNTGAKLWYNKDMLF